MTYKLISLLNHTARKPHKCIWCPEPITTGEKYKAEVSTYGGDFQAFDWHPECWDAARSYTADAGGDSEFEAGQFKRGSTEQH